MRCVVMQESDPHHAKWLDAERLRERQRVVVAMPCEDVSRRQVLDDLRRRSRGVCECDRRYPLSQAIRICDAVDLDPIHPRQSLEKTAAELALGFFDRGKGPGQASSARAGFPKCPPDPGQILDRGA